MAHKNSFIPLFINFQITRKCNLNCMHCGFNAGEERIRELTLDEIIEVVNELYYLNCKKIQITGGEPLLREDVFDIINYTSSLGIDTQILSNGFYITEEVVTKLKNSGISGVGISLDGLKKSHDTFRRFDGAFEKVIDALKLLIKNNIRTNVLTTVNKLSLHELDELYTLLHGLKINNWIIQTTARVGRMQQFNEFALDPKDSLILEKFIYKKQNLNGINIIPGDSIGYYSEFENKIRNGKSFTGCYAGIYQMGILSDGSVVGCLAMPHTKEFIEGNIREKSLSSIWFDENSFSYNRKFKPELLEGYCKVCKHGNICKAGCKANAYGATGNLFNNPYCTYKENNNNK